MSKAVDELLRANKVAAEEHRIAYAKEYAKQEAIEFATFISPIPYHRGIGKWLYFDSTGRYNMTTEELYELFQQSKNKKP